MANFNFVELPYRRVDGVRTPSITKIVCANDLKDVSESTLTIKGNTTNTNATVLGISDTSLLNVGDRVAGTGIPAGATISAIGEGQITLSANATATNTGVVLTITQTNATIWYGLNSLVSKVQLGISQAAIRAALVTGIV